MKNKFTFLSILVLTILVGCNSVGGSDIISTPSGTNNSQTTQTPTTSKPTTSVKPGETTSLYEATIPSTAPNYYEDVRGLKGEALKNKLNEIISKNHNAYSYGSQINQMMKDYDVMYNDHSKFNLIYSGEASFSADYDKEHVWAKSHGDFGTSTGAGSDLHNLRPCLKALNSGRGNKDFAEGGTETAYKGNYMSSSTFEPRDDYKGDVARTIFYMATRYEGSLDLELDAPSNTSRYLDLSKGADGIHGKFDDLYKWATSGIDPVDNFEVRRNNIIYDKYQKNRNPFVDHPEFIIMIYDKNYNGDGALNDLTGTGESLQDSARAVEDLILAIGEVTLDSLDAIEQAEKAYEKLSEAAKKLVSKEIYDILVKARETYNQLVEANKVNYIISLIDSIGEVTLDDKDLIEEIESLYDSLTEEQKKEVTNYDVLLAARAKLDELLSALPPEGQVIYSGEFASVSGNWGYTANKSFELNGKTWASSYSYKEGGKTVRLGNKAAANLDNKFTEALSYTGSGSSLEMAWDVANVNEITFVTEKGYSKTEKYYILKSVDGGNTYTKLSEFTNSEGPLTLTYSGSYDTSVRFALVITGAAARLDLASVEIKGLK